MLQESHNFLCFAVLVNDVRMHWTWSSRRKQEMSTEFCSGKLQSSGKLLENNVKTGLKLLVW
jgi:hypothetical protein